MLPIDPGHISIIIRRRFHYIISPEFLQPYLGQHDCQHRFAYYSRGGYHTYITAFVTTLAYILMRPYINGWQRMSKRGNRLYCSSNNYWRSITDPPLYSPRIICEMLPTLLVA